MNVLNSIKKSIREFFYGRPGELDLQPVGIADGEQYHNPDHTRELLADLHEGKTISFDVKPSTKETYQINAVKTHRPAPLRPFTIGGEKIMARSKKDAIKRFNRAHGNGKG